MMRLTFAFLVGAFVSISSQAFALDGKVVRVIDGDTIAVLTSENREQKVRLASIDAPEKKQPFGTAAKQKLSELLCGQQIGRGSCQGKRVHVTEDTIDRYGRIIGLVTTEDININKEMVKAGLAWVYGQYLNDRDRAFLLWQAEAKRAHDGLWADPNPTPPWEFRKAKKKAAD